jgi:serine acetyltransferase
MGHDSVVGDDCEICAGVVLCGHVVIGNNVRVGGNTWIKPRVTIGDGAIIGGGSVVTKDVPAHEVWCGNPAKFLKVAWTHPSLNELEQRQRAAAFPSTADILEYVGARSPHDMRQRMFQRETGQPPILAEYIYE